jgi:hypothetical protein
MPFWQWPTWAQKNQRGVVALSTVKLHSGTVEEVLSTFWKPESMPCAGVVWMVQGLAKVDWVTV